MAEKLVDVRNKLEEAEEKIKQAERNLADSHSEIKEMKGGERKGQPGVDRLPRDN